MNVENKLAKALEKKDNFLVVKAADRDKVLAEISARAARYQKFNPDLYDELMVLRGNIKSVFDKGLDPGLDLMEQLYFLDPATKELVERMTATYDQVVTPTDFKRIASIMSGYLAEEVPILKDFTRYFGRLAEEYLTYAKPKDSAIDAKLIVKGKILGSYKSGFIPNKLVARALGIKPGKPLTEEMLSWFGFWRPNGNLSDLLYGVRDSKNRITGRKFEIKFKVPTLDLKNLALGEEKKLISYNLFKLKPNKLPKKWLTVPWVNFDGKIIEQEFTQTFEERLLYKNPDGTWSTNILQIPQKTQLSWWDEISNGGSVDDIADVGKARTAYAVNGVIAVLKPCEFKEYPY